MAQPDTIENKRLADAAGVLDEAVAAAHDGQLARLSLLESAACLYSGISERVYREATGYPATEHELDGYAEKLLDVIGGSGVPVPLALSSLARAEMDAVETKKNGAVYTDYRLAAHLARKAMDSYSGGPIVDTACGTSILLAACASEWQRRGRDVGSLVADCIYGVDLSPLAVRGSILALATFLRSASELEKLASHFAIRDSLALGVGLCDLFGVGGFSLVVGNPPWERVRPSRNEYARENGIVVDYGSEISNLPMGYERRREESRERSVQLAQVYGLKGGMDLYRAFLTLSTMICNEGGTVALYLPAGLIRSKSLAETRNDLIHEFSEVDISVFMNHAKFFAIDSRFKFVLANLRGKVCNGVAQNVAFSYCTADDESVVTTSVLTLDNALFSDSSGELGAPEVKTGAEADVLKRIWEHGVRMKEHPLFSGIRPVRELDMTLDRFLFDRSNSGELADDELPLIEGRMVSQFRCGCKEYVSGSGRSAQWNVVPPGVSRIAPQFYVPQSRLDAILAQRADCMRIGFCDIAGQTNERAMQAAVIPAGCACGNKVPTLLFQSERDALLWLGIVNSFAFDWVVRRYITTTINFFILENLPFPRLDPDGELASSIAERARCVSGLINNGTTLGHDDIVWYAEERAALDALVFDAYGLRAEDLEMVIADFPLVDQVNARLCNGLRPTLDMLRAFVAGDEECRARAISACESGAMPYIPNEQMRSLMK